MSAKKPPPEPTRLVGLTPELWARVQRLAEAKGITTDQVVADAVGVAWVRHAAAKRLKPEAW